MSPEKKLKLRLELEKRKRLLLEEKRSMSFQDYYKIRYPNYDFAPHIQIMTKALQDLGPRDALIINTPPRHSKSDSLSAFCEWYLGGGKGRGVIYVSYSSSLSNDRSRLMRNEIQSGLAFPEYAPDQKLSDSAKGVSFWALENGNTFISAGSQGSVVGKGCDIMLIDDPHKNREEASSSVIREKITKGFIGDLVNRLTPDGNIVLVGTRWHEDDLTGYILKQIEKDENFLGYNWQHLNMKAISTNDETGEKQALWESRYSLANLLKMQEADEYSFSALYQQNPIPDGNSIFRDVYFYDEEALPTAGYKVSITTDFAYSSKNYADFSVMLTGRFYEGKLYITDLVRLQVEFEVFVSHLEQQQNETGAKIKTRIGAMEKTIVESIKGRVDIDYEFTKGDKLSNSYATASQYNNGNILLPKDAPWVKDVISELHSFGVGSKNDDIVDCLVTMHNEFFGGNKSISSLFWSAQTSFISNTGATPRKMVN